MSVKFKDNVDLFQNQLINIVVHKSSTDPTGGVEGQFYYNDVSNVLKYHDGTNWVALGAGSISNVVGGNGLTSVNAGGVVTLDVNVDDATIEISADTLRIKDGGVSTAKIGNNQVTSVKIADQNILFAKIQNIPTMTVIGRVAAGTGVTSAISIINDNNLVGADGSTLVTSGAIKAYVDGRIASLGTPQGGFNASTETQFPGTSSTVAGSYWWVTNPGTVNGVPLQAGDILFANVNNPSPTNPADWSVVEGNRDQATTTVLGLVMLATNAEVQAGTNNTKAITPSTLSSRTATESRTGIAAIATNSDLNTGADDTKIVTPLKLRTYLTAVLNSNYYVSNVGNGAATVFTVTHGLSTGDVMVQLYENSTGDIIYTTVTNRTANTFDLSFSKPPANNEFRVMAFKVVNIT